MYVYEGDFWYRKLAVLDKIKTQALPPDSPILPSIHISQYLHVEKREAATSNRLNIVYT